MSDNKKYYYIRLKENFFDSDEIVILESMKDGFLYSNILLKLYLKSLKNEGKLMMTERIPYSVEMIATITRHQVGTVQRAIEIFREIGLIDILDNGAIYMSDIQNFIGKSSSEADRKRAYRNIIENEILEIGQMSGQMSDKYPPEIEIELEKELELKKELEIKRELEQSKEPKQKKSKKENDDALIKSMLHTHTSHSELLETLDDFVEYRKAKKNPLSVQGCKGLLKKLSAVNDEEQIIALNSAMEGGWTSVYPKTKEELSSYKKQGGFNNASSNGSSTKKSVLDGFKLDITEL